MPSEQTLFRMAQTFHLCSEWIESVLVTKWDGKKWNDKFTVPKPFTKHHVQNCIDCTSFHDQIDIFYELIYLLNHPNTRTTAKYLNELVEKSIIKIHVKFKRFSFKKKKINWILLQQNAQCIWNSITYEFLLVFSIKLRSFSHEYPFELFTKYYFIILCHRRSLLLLI